jgi:hypothetical protein
MTNAINYQQIFEDEVSVLLREKNGMQDRFYELDHNARLLVEELISAGYHRAVMDALDPEVLLETSAMAGEMGSQLHSFANLVQTFLNNTSYEDES